jgi:hypothetical protein
VTRKLLRRIWSPEEETYVLDNWKQASARRIGRHIGRSKQAVIARIAKLRVQHANEEKTIGEDLIESPHNT